MPQSDVVNQTMLELATQIPSEPTPEMKKITDGGFNRFYDGEGIFNNYNNTDVAIPTEEQKRASQSLIEAVVNEKANKTPAIYDKNQGVKLFDVEVAKVLKEMGVVGGTATKSVGPGVKGAVYDRIDYFAKKYDMPHSEVFKIIEQKLMEQMITFGVERDKAVRPKKMEM